MKVAIDAMGGDHAPEAIVEGAMQAAKELDTDALMKVLAQRETAKAEDMMRAAVVKAQGYFNKMYK